MVIQLIILVNLVQEETVQHVLLLMVLLTAKLVLEHIIWKEQHAYKHVQMANTNILSIIHAYNVPIIVIPVHKLMVLHV